LLASALHGPILDEAFAIAKGVRGRHARCQPARLDFPAIWHSVLKRHVLAVGPPVNSVRAGHIALEVPLITGQRLVFDSSSSELALG